MAFRLLLYHQLEDWATEKLNAAGVEIKLRQREPQQAYGYSSRKPKAVFSRNPD